MCAVYSTTPGDRHRVRFHLSSRGFAALIRARPHQLKDSSPDQVRQIIPRRDHLIKVRMPVHAGYTLFVR